MKVLLVAGTEYCEYDEVAHYLDDKRPGIVLLPMLGWGDDIKGAQSELAPVVRHTLEWCIRNAVTCVQLPAVMGADGATAQRDAITCLTLCRSVGQMAWHIACSDDPDGHDAYHRMMMLYAGSYDESVRTRDWPFPVRVMYDFSVGNNVTTIGTPGPPTPPPRPVQQGQLGRALRASAMAELHADAGSVAIFAGEPLPISRAAMDPPAVFPAGAASPFDEVRWERVPLGAPDYFTTYRGANQQEDDDVGF